MHVNLYLKKLNVGWLTSGAIELDRDLINPTLMSCYFYWKKFLMIDKDTKNQVKVFGLSFTIFLVLLVLGILTVFIESGGNDWNIILFGLFLYIPFAIGFSLINAFVFSWAIDLLKKTFLNLKKRLIISSVVPSIIVLIWFIFEQFEPQIYNWKLDIQESIIFLFLISISNFLTVIQNLNRIQ